MKKIMALTLLVSAIALAALLPAMAQQVAFFNDGSPVGGVAKADL